MKFFDKLRSKLLLKRKEIDNKLYRLKIESEQQRAAKLRKPTSPGTLKHALKNISMGQGFIDAEKELITGVINNRRNKRMVKNEHNRKG